jgi:hypothetical protein
LSSFLPGAAAADHSDGTTNSGAKSQTATAGGCRDAETKQRPYATPT